jgi:hypothetical protein
VIAPRLLRPLMAVQIANHGSDFIFFAQLGEFARDFLRIEWTGATAYHIDDKFVVFLMPNGDAVTIPANCAASGVSEGSVKVATSIWKLDGSCAINGSINHRII